MKKTIDILFVVLTICGMIIFSYFGHLYSIKNNISQTKGIGIGLAVSLVVPISLCILWVIGNFVHKLLGNYRILINISGGRKFWFFLYIIYLCFFQQFFNIANVFTFISATAINSSAKSNISTFQNYVIHFTDVLEFIGSSFIVFLIPLVLFIAIGFISEFIFNFFRKNKFDEPILVISKMDD